MPPRWNALELTSILCDQIASPDAELAAATAVREDEAKDYSKSEAELADDVGTLERAISIIQREVSKNPALLQKKIDTGTINNVISALTAVIEDDSELSAAATGSVSHSSDIVNVLNNLLDKAEEE